VLKEGALTPNEPRLAGSSDVYDVTGGCMYYSITGLMDLSEIRGGIFISKEAYL
jgi:hypothetical protein